MTETVRALGPGDWDAVARLKQTVEGQDLPRAELEWFYERAPLGPRVISGVWEGDRLLGSVGMTFRSANVGGSEVVAAVPVHAATLPEARGSGIFTRLELRNEQQSANAGAALALAFPNPRSLPIFLGPLGWSDLGGFRLWARLVNPLRLGRRTDAPRFGPATRRFTAPDVHPKGEADNRLLPDAEYLNWRYVDTPRDYGIVEVAGSVGTLRGTSYHGRPAALVCDLLGPSGDRRRLLRACARAARAGGAAVVVVAAPAPRDGPAYLAAGFAPTPTTIPVVGKSLQPGAVMPRSWSFSLGDLDFV